MTTYHCSTCGEEVTEYCQAHPEARVDSLIRVTKESAKEAAQ